MNEKWVKWMEYRKIPQNFIIERLIDNMSGLNIELCDVNDKSNKIAISFPDHVIAFRNRDEGDFLRKFEYLKKIYGEYYYINWSMFEVENSEYIKWLNYENYDIYMNSGIKHYVIMGDNDIVEILSNYEPVISLNK